MATASGANTPMAYKAESTYGTPPSGVDYAYIAQKDDRFTPGLEYARSELLTLSPFPKNTILVDANGQGGFNSELLYAAHDDFILAALRATAFSSVTEVTGNTITAAAADNSFNDSGNGFTVANGFGVGKWVRTKGFVAAANNSYFKILTRTDAKITVAGGTLVNASGDAAHKVKPGKQAVDGTATPSFTFERQYKDKTNLWAYSPGHVITGWDLNVAPKGILQCNFVTQGKPEVSATAARGTGTYTAVSNNPPLNAVTDVRAFLFNYAALTSVVDISFALKHEVEPISVIGTLGAIEQAFHDASLEGNFRVLLPDTHTLADTALNNTAGAFALVMKDSLGQAMVLDLPEVKFKTLDRANPGRKSTIYLAMGYEANIDPSEGVAVRVAKWDD